MFLYNAQDPSSVSTGLRVRSIEDESLVQSNKLLFSGSIEKTPDSLRKNQEVLDAKGSMEKSESL